LFMDYVLLLCCIQYEIMSVIYIMSLMWFIWVVH
jgi:hypothetical protein